MVPDAVPLIFSYGAMANCDDLLEKARRAPAGLRFEEACRLAECWGFYHRPSKAGGSHRMYKRKGMIKHLNFQARGGKAIAYQVRQLLSVIDEISEQERD